MLAKGASTGYILWKFQRFIHFLKFKFILFFIFLNQSSNKNTQSFANKS